jgi:acyl-CoA thioester hydrolase
MTGRASEHGRAQAGSAREFRWPIRVYYQHTDAGGMVFHGRYLDFLEAARTEMIEAMGFDLGDMARRDGLIFVVHSLQITYHKPALLNDLLSVSARPLKVGRARLLLEQKVRRDEATLVSAELTLACLHGERHQLVALPQALAQKFQEKT